MTSPSRVLFAALFERWRRDYRFKTLVSAGGSFAATVLFAAYNGFLGLRVPSLWNGSICVYYLLLAALRGSILRAERRLAAMDPAAREPRRARYFTATSTALLALNLALIAPAALMVELRRPVTMGLIPALATAAYATLKVARAIVNYRAKNRSDDALVRELRVVNLIDALVSLLTLQNTLIMVQMSDGDGSMTTLTAISSAAILAIIASLSLVNLRAALRPANRRRATNSLE